MGSWDWAPRGCSINSCTQDCKNGVQSAPRRTSALFNVDGSGSNNGDYQLLCNQGTAPRVLSLSPSVFRSLGLSVSRSLGLSVSRSLCFLLCLCLCLYLEVLVSVSRSRSCPHHCNRHYHHQLMPPRAAALPVVPAAPRGTRTGTLTSAAAHPTPSPVLPQPAHPRAGRRARGGHFFAARTYRAGALPPARPFGFVRTRPPGGGPPRPARTPTTPTLTSAREGRGEMGSPCLLVHTRCCVGRSSRRRMFSI